MARTAGPVRRPRRFKGSRLSIHAGLAQDLAELVQRAAPDEADRAGGQPKAAGNLLIRQGRLLEKQEAQHLRAALRQLGHAFAYNPLLLGLPDAPGHVWGDRNLRYGIRLNAFQRHLITLPLPPAERLAHCYRDQP